jgi:hypothetical protein
MDLIINRIHNGWSKFVEVDKGWYNIIILLDQQLSCINPNYNISIVYKNFNKENISFINLITRLKSIALLQ